MLSYDCEAMVPDELEDGSSEVAQRVQLDLLNEVRMSSQVKLAAYQQRVSRFCNRKVKVRALKVGDLVLRKVMPNMKIDSHGVFRVNWEGSYKVRAVLWEGTYYLE